VLLSSLIRGNDMDGLCSENNLALFSSDISASTHVTPPSVVFSIII